MKRYKSVFKESTIPTEIKVGKKYESADGVGELEITAIGIDSFHTRNPEVYLEFNWYNDETKQKGKSRQSLTSFKINYFTK